MQVLRGIRIFLWKLRNYWDTYLFFHSPVNTPISVKINSSSCHREIYIKKDVGIKTVCSDELVRNGPITISPITKFPFFNKFATIHIFHWHNLKDKATCEKHYNSWHQDVIMYLIQNNNKQNSGRGNKQKDTSKGDNTKHIIDM